MKLSSYLSKEKIISNLKGETFEELITNLLTELAKTNKQVKMEKEIMKKAILKRENEASTYIGHGVAIPHARLEYFDDIIIAMAFPEKKITMTSPTGEEEIVEFIVLIIADVLKNKNILKIMSGISRLCLKNRDILKEILTYKSSEKTLEILTKANIEINHTITAEDLLSTSIIPAKENNTLEDIAKRIIIDQVTGIPVVDSQNNFLGEITERELISFGMPKHTTILNDLSFLIIGEPFENYLVNEKITIIKDLYRTEGIITIDRDAPLMEISYIFMNKGVTRIYVTENNKYLGTIFRSDIIKKILHI
ncbi:PTS sugar transporter subunit IIA [Candidatus Cetobacterium colombiensis]|jgi:PTS system nitrogen regulatory IIA component|uniref:PTS sugar transporter subunit IIA n=1 Tax=Candidatus Cetobacterium colombiensis TaxID=3073100 RepID=A0ABU4WAX7_9FUSO|nr:PTS sugar transporter subunit IIA [Candidatus Cetobacterium colombiensis]MDX8335814.1 PTS sugar transporter subunit IIA [Candidatus Cetobacterium colombiensis]